MGEAKRKEANASQEGSDWNAQMRKLFELDDSADPREVFLAAQKAKLESEEYKKLFETINRELVLSFAEFQSVLTVNSMYLSALTQIADWVDYYIDVDEELNPASLITAVKDFLKRIDDGAEARTAEGKAFRELSNALRFSRQDVKSLEESLRLESGIRNGMENRLCSVNSAHSDITGMLGIPVKTPWPEVVEKLREVMSRTLQ